MRSRDEMTLEEAGIGPAAAMTRQQPATAEGRELLDWCNSVQYDERNLDRILALEAKRYDDGLHKGIDDTLRVLDNAKKAAAPQPAEAVALLPHRGHLLAVIASSTEDEDATLVQLMCDTCEVEIRSSLVSEDAALANQPAAETAGLDVERLATGLHLAQIGCWGTENETWGCLERHAKHNIPNPGDEWAGTMHDEDAERILARLAMSDPEAGGES